MDRVKKLQEIQSWVRLELERSARFWLDNGMDREHGGVYTCLDRKGEIYSTDKSVWMQGRCGWIYAFLCHTYGAREEWLAASKSCLDFMEAHCLNRQANDRMYFTVTADGKPLRQRRYYFSEAFYAMANAEYYGVTGEEACLQRARRAYDMYWDRHGRPHRSWPQNHSRNPAGPGLRHSDDLPECDIGSAAVRSGTERAL